MKWAFLIPLLMLLSGKKAGDRIISYVADPQNIQLYWKNDSGQLFGSIQRLKDYLDHRQKRLVFAMNGGMFNPDQSPVGLFIQRQRLITPLDTAAGQGNF